MFTYVDIFSGALAAIYVMLHGAHARWTTIAVFVLVAASMIVTKQALWSSVIIAILVSYMACLPTRSGATAATSEHFSNAPEAEDDDAAEEDDAAEDDDDAGAEAEDDDGQEEFDGGGVDMFKTMLESYKSLTPGQVEHMTSDTKELIETQKSLLETVKSLAPVVTQGKEMLDTFKGYFGPDTKDMLGAAMKTLGGKEAGTKRRRKRR